MTEGTPNTDSTGAGAAGSTGDSVEQQPKTVEEVEAFWRNRFSSRDRAHNAETAALRAQMEAMQQQPAPPPVDDTPEAARVRALESELQQERAARQAEALKNQYPLAAGMLGDDIANVKTEHLAAIEAGIDAGVVAPRIDPNAAPRSPQAGMPNGGAKPLNEKTKDELLADLRRAAPAYQEAMKEGF